jgi:fucose permease
MHSAEAAQPTGHDDEATRRAMRAVFVVFIGMGVATASWASRIPQVKHELHLTPKALGGVILAFAIGSLCSLPLAGLVVHRLGAERTIRLMSMLCAVGVAVMGVGVQFGVPPVMAGLFLAGFGNGMWDVATNVEAAAIEQRAGRSLMPRFHAGFSVGTVMGGLVGAGMNAIHVNVTAHLIGMALLIGVGVPLASFGFLPMVEVPHDEHAERKHPLHAWVEPRTLLIGLFVLTMAFAEGTANDWLGVAAIEGYGASAAVGSLAYVVFVTGMTVCRWFGPGLIDRYGRVVAMRASAACAMVGLLIVVFGPNLATAAIGAVLWGFGAALGFPTGMSAAGDEPQYAAARVSVVATIGYCAFLAGPALIGLVGNHVGVLHALTVTAGLLGVGVLVAGSTKPLVSEPVSAA